MRPTFARSSGMPGPKTYNPWWGDPAVMKQKYIKQYTISPFQARAAPNMLRSYLFNGYRRLSAEAFYFLIPIGIGYGIYSWGVSYDAWAKSKAGHLALEGGH